jgi:hypothetical protein
MTELGIHPSKERRRARAALSLAVVSAMVTLGVASWLPAAEGQVACVPPTPTPTETPPGPGFGADAADRVVTLSADKGTVTYGGTVIMTGTLSDADGTCIPNVRVNIEGETLGIGLPAKGGHDETNDEGVFVAAVKVSASAEYTAVAPGETNEDPEVTSAPVTVLAKVDMTARTRDLSPERGTKIEITARMKPSYPGSEAVLQRKKVTGWGNVKTDKANNTGFTFKIKANWKGKRIFRVTWIKPEGADHEPGSSNRLKIKPKKPRDDDGRNRGGRG